MKVTANQRVKIMIALVVPEVEDCVVMVKNTKLDVSAHAVDIMRGRGHDS